MNLRHNSERDEKSCGVNEDLEADSKYKYITPGNRRDKYFYETLIIGSSFSTHC